MVDPHALELSRPSIVPQMFKMIMTMRPATLQIRTPRTAWRSQSLANHKIKPHARFAPPRNRKLRVACGSTKPLKAMDTRSDLSYRALKPPLLAF